GNFRNLAVTVTSCPFTTSRVGLSTPGWEPIALIPNGLLVPGGMAAPQALSTIHCAIVIDTGMLQRRWDASAASTTVWGITPKCPICEGGSALFTNGRAARE